MRKALSHVKICNGAWLGGCFFKRGRWGHSARWGKKAIFANWIIWGQYIRGMNGIWNHVQELNAMVFVCQLKNLTKPAWASAGNTGLKRARWCKTVCVCPGAHPSLCQMWLKPELETVTGHPTSAQNGAHTDSHTLTHIEPANSASSCCSGDIYTQPF